MSLTLDEQMKYRNSAVHDLFLHANAALFELHRYIETEYKDEVWRSIYGTRLELASAEKGIQFRHFTKPEPTEGETIV